MPLTRSGVLVDRVTGTPTLEDITYSLAQMPRFAGHTSQPWTVLDHSVYAMLLSTEVRYPELHLAVLLHDAHECITGDIPSDVKTDDIRVLQQSLDERIMNRYLPGGYRQYEEMHDQIAGFDRRALAAEALVLGPPCETDGWREKVFGTARPEDVDRLKTVQMKPAHPEGVITAINALMDRIKRT